MNCQLMTLNSSTPEKGYNMNVDNYYLIKSLKSKNNKFLGASMTSYGLDENVKTFSDNHYSYTSIKSGEKEYFIALELLRNLHYVAYLNKNRMEYIKEKGILPPIINSLFFNKNVNLLFFKNVSRKEFIFYEKEMGFIKNSFYFKEKNLKNLLLSENSELVEYFIEKFKERKLSYRQKQKIINLPLKNYEKFLSRMDSQRDIDVIFNFNYNRNLIDNIFYNEIDVFKSIFNKGVDNSIKYSKDQVVRHITTVPYIQKSIQSLLKLKKMTNIYIEKKELNSVMNEDETLKNNFKRRM